MKLLEALLQLNQAFMIEGYSSDFVLKLQTEDFNRFGAAFEREHHHLISYPDLQPWKTLKEINQIKIAGPGSYFLIERAQKKAQALD